MPRSISCGSVIINASSLARYPENASTRRAQRSGRWRSEIKLERGSIALGLGAAYEVTETLRTSLWRFPTRGTPAYAARHDSDKRQERLMHASLVVALRMLAQGLPMSTCNGGKRAHMAELRSPRLPKARARPNAPCDPRNLLGMAPPSARHGRRPPPGHERRALRLEPLGRNGFPP